MVGAAFIFALPARAEGDLDPGGLTFRDFATADRGASFGRGDSMIGGGPDQTSARLLGIDNANGLARVRFEPVKVEIAVPLGWQANVDWERGTSVSGDKSYRLILWRVDFAFEGVKDAEHYAASKVGAIQARRPGVHGQARKLPDGSFLIVYENLGASAGGDRESRTVFDLVMPNPSDAKQGFLLTLGVPASDSNRGLKLLALLKSKIRIDW